jgi:hypothetical protein
VLTTASAEEIAEKLIGWGDKDDKLWLIHKLITEHLKAMQRGPKLTKEERRAQKEQRAEMDQEARESLYGQLRNP